MTDDAPQSGFVAPPANDDGLLVFDEGPVRHLRLNRPERLNAIDLGMHERLLAEVRLAEADSTVRVLVFSGSGAAFCAGDHLKARRHTWPQRYEKHQVALDIGIGPMLLMEVATAFRDFPKPTVALLHGFALGAGYDLATSMDWRVATQDCVVGDPRIKLGIWAAEGWSYRDTRLIPQTYVSQLHYIGDPPTAEQAQRMGLIHRVFPSGTNLREAAKPLLAELLALDGDRYAATKRRLLDDLDLSYEAALQHTPSLRRRPFPVDQR